METIGKKIRRLRASRGLTLAQMGKQINASVSVISDWENDKKTPRASSLQRLADFFGIAVSDLHPASGESMLPHQKTSLSVGEIVRRLRYKHRLKMKDLAKILETSPTTISSWENMGKCPRPEMLKKVADYFEISEADLMNCNPAILSPNATKASVLAARIRQLRQSKNITANDFAQQIDTSESTIIAWESGIEEPNAGMRDRIAKVFGIMEVDLFVNDSNINDVRMAYSTPDKETLRHIPVFSDTPDFFEYYLQHGVLPPDMAASFKGVASDDTHAFFLSVGKDMAFRNNLFEGDLLLIEPNKKIKNPSRCLYFFNRQFFVKRYSMEAIGRVLLLPMNLIDPPVTIPPDMPILCLPISSHVMA